MNQTKVLQKCVDELGKEKPDISYIKGMLETIISLSNFTFPPVNSVGQIIRTEIKSDENIEIPAAGQVGPIGKLNS